MTLEIYPCHFQSYHETIFLEVNKQLFSCIKIIKILMSILILVRFQLISNYTFNVQYMLNVIFIFLRANLKLKAEKNSHFTHTFMSRNYLQLFWYVLQETSSFFCSSYLFINAQSLIMNIQRSFFPINTCNTKRKQIIQLPDTENEFCMWKKIFTINKDNNKKMNN